MPIRSRRSWIWPASVYVLAALPAGGLLMGCGAEASEPSLIVENGRLIVGDGPIIEAILAVDLAKTDRHLYEVPLEGDRAWQATCGNRVYGAASCSRSADSLYHVKEDRPTTLTIHGAEDERVHPTQGREFYRALRRLSMFMEMMLYPCSGHVLTEPKQLMDLTPG